MELHYDITKQDFIDFNLNYYNNNAIVQRSIRTMRIATAAIVILGGSVALKIPGCVEDVEMRVKSKVFSTIAPLVNVVKTNLNEDSGLLGGACLVFLKK